MIHICAAAHVPGGKRVSLYFLQQSDWDCYGPEGQWYQLVRGLTDEEIEAMKKWPGFVTHCSGEAEFCTYHAGGRTTPRVSPALSHKIAAFITAGEPGALHIWLADHPEAGQCPSAR